MGDTWENYCLNKNIILIDFFDTLVHRRISACNVRDSWAKKMSFYLQNGISAQNLISYRKRATYLAASMKNVEEIKYSDIMNELYLLIHDKTLDSKEKFIETCVNYEIECELDSLYIDDNMFKFLSYEHSIKKTIIVVSDFYLSGECLQIFTDKLGLSKILDQIIVSSDYGVKKSSGNLYKIVIENIGDPNNMIMFGDNKKADYEVPQRLGIDSVWVRYKNYPKYNVIKDELQRICRSGRKSIFANYSFLYYYYIERLYFRLVELHACKVFFLSREGYFLKQLFEIYTKDKEYQIQTIYLYVSRKSTLLASLSGRNEIEFNAIFNSYHDLDIISFLRNLSFSDSEIYAVTNELSLDCENVIYNFRDSLEFKALLNSVQFQNIMDEKCTKERKLLKDYIYQNGINPGEEIILVDVGWKGTIQDNIFLSLDNENPVRGLYLGFENMTGYENYLNVKEGLVFSKYPMMSKNLDIFDFETHLIEQMLAAPHGSTAGYKRLSDTVVPIFENYSDDDKELYQAASQVQEDITRLFLVIEKCFKNTSYNASDMFDYFSVLHLKSALLLNANCIEFEKIALTPKTNNFGWFKHIPTRDSKTVKARSMIADLKRVKKSKCGFLSYLNYFAVKLNARKKYNWKLITYRIAYFIERILLLTRTR